MTQNTTTTSEPGSLWAVLVSPRQRRLLEACVDWHARVHADARLAQEFAELARAVRDARPIHEAA